MPQTILGIDIGTYSIKIAEIERSLRKFQLVGFFEQPIIGVESIGREAATAQALMRLVEEYNLSPDSVFTALPGQYVSHRAIELPFSDFKKVDQTIEFEMENYVPLPLEELLIDYQFLSSSKAGSTVLVSYAKKSDFVKFLNMMTEVDIDPRYVGSEPVEMANLMKLGVLHPEDVYSIVDIGHEKTNILIFSGAQLQFARTIMMGGKDLTESIAKSLSIPLIEAERMKVEIGQVGTDPEGTDETTRNVSEAMKAKLEELLLHLKQTFMAFQEKKGDVIQAIVLCGGTSRLLGIDQYLSSKLRKNVSFLDCLDLPINQLADSQWCRPIAASALSLAYRGVMGTKISDIQFRRGEFAYKGEVKDYIILAKQAGFLLGAVMLFAIGSFGMSYMTLKARAKNHASQISKMAAEILPDAPKKSLSNPSAIVSILSGKITEAQDRQKKIGDELQTSILDILKELSATLPPRDTLQLDVDNFLVASRRIRIQGRTNSFPAVDQLKEALSKSKLFKNVTTDNVKKGSKEEIKFNLSIELSDAVEEGA